MSSIQPELKYLLPLRPRQRVMVLGEDYSAAADLQIRDIVLIAILPAQSDEGYADTAFNRTRVMPHGLPVASASMDHVLISELAESQAEWLLLETARVLKPEGWLVIRLNTAGRLHHRQLPNDYKPSTNGYRASRLSLKACHRHLRLAGFVMVNTYGIAHNGEHEQFLVPLDQSGAARYFFRETSASHSQLAPIARLYTQVMTAVGLQRLLFKHVAVLAQRTSARIEDHATQSAARD